MAVSVEPSKKPEESRLDALAPTSRPKLDCEAAASQPAVISAASTEAAAAKPGQTQPPGDRGRVSHDRAGDQRPEAHAGPPARAWSSPASTRSPRITSACVRKNPSGTALHEVSKSETARPNARRIAKSASMGASVIKRTFAFLTASAVVLSTASNSLQPPIMTRRPDRSQRGIQASGGAHHFHVRSNSLMLRRIPLDKEQAMKATREMPWIAVAVGRLHVGSWRGAWRPTDRPKPSSRILIPSRCPGSTSQGEMTRLMYASSSQSGRNRMEKRAALILELYKTAPDHARIPVLMRRAVEGRPPTGSARLEDTIKEIEQVSSQTNDPKFKLDAIYRQGPDQAGQEPLQRHTRSFRRSRSSSSWLPKTRGAASLLYHATRAAKDRDVKTALEDRILKDFPDSTLRGNDQRRPSPARSDRQAL